MWFCNALYSAVLVARVRLCCFSDKNYTCFVSVSRVRVYCSSSSQVRLYCVFLPLELYSAVSIGRVRFSVTAITSDCAELHWSVFQSVQLGG